MLPHLKHFWELMLTIYLTPAADLALNFLGRQMITCSKLPDSVPNLVCDSGDKREVDLSAYIFGTELLTILFVALFYQPLLKHSSGLFDGTQVENQFPKGVIIVLMTLSFLIVVDRVLFLCSFASGKAVTSAV